MAAMNPDMVLYSMVAMRPDMALYSEGEGVVYFIELTIPFEDMIEEAFDRKRLKYMELVVKAREFNIFSCV